MDISSASRLLSAQRPQTDAKGIPEPALAKPLAEMGVKGPLTGDALTKAQGNLLVSMEESLKAAGHSPSILRAGDLGEAAARLRGELPPAELHRILADTTGGKWGFAQNADGTIRAVEASGITQHGMPSMTRAEIANRAVNKFDSKVGIGVLDETLKETAGLVARNPGTANKQSVAWSREWLSETAGNVVTEAKNAGRLAASGETGKEAAVIVEKTLAKTALKSAAKALPIVGLGVVIADTASAADDTVQNIRKHEYKDAAIDGVRTASKAVFGVVGQIANVTLVGGVAVNVAGEAVDAGLSKLKHLDIHGWRNKNEPATQQAHTDTKSTKPS